MFSTKILSELLKEDYSKFDSIHEMMTKLRSDTDEPLVVMLRMLSVIDFKYLCLDLRTTDMIECNNYVKLLLGEKPDKFWDADPDTVYNGIIAIMNRLRDTKHGREIGFVFKLLMNIIVNEANNKLTNLFYSPEFFKRLSRLRGYGIAYTVESEKRFFMHVSFYAYMEDMLRNNKKQYEKLKAQPKDDSLYKFIGSIVDSIDCYTVINSFLSNKEFKDNLLNYLADVLRSDPLPHVAGKAYAILLIYFNGADVTGVYGRTNGKKSDLVHGYVYNQVAAINSKLELIHDYLSTSKKCYAKAALGRLSKMDTSHLNDTDKLICSNLRKFCERMLE